MKEIGDTILLYVKLNPLDDTMITVFNNYYNEGREIHTSSNPQQTSKFTCTIAGFIDETYGKFPEDIDNNALVVMEYNQFFPWVIPSLRTKQNRDDYIAYQS